MNNISVLVSLDLTKKAGLFHAVHERNKALVKSGENVTVFNIHYKDSILIKVFKLMFGKKTDNISEYNLIDGIRYNDYFIKRSIIRMCISKLLYGKVTFGISKKLKSLITESNIVISHWGLMPSSVARYCIKGNEGIDFYIYCHGSDVLSTISNPRRYKKEFQSNINSANCVFFVSKSLRLSATHSIGLNNIPHYFKISYNTTNQDIFHKEIRIKNSKKTRQKKLYKIAFVGNIEPIKNVKIFPELISKIEEKVDCIFYIVGRGSLENELKSEMKSQVKRYVFINPLDQLALAKFYNNIDILLLLSEFESFGMVLLEALACGSNILGSSYCGVSEVLPDNYFIDLTSNDIESIANVIIDKLTTYTEILDNFEIYTWNKIVANDMLVMRQYSKEKVKV